VTRCNKISLLPLSHHWAAYLRPTSSKEERGHAESYGNGNENKNEKKLKTITMMLMQTGGGNKQEISNMAHFTSKIDKRRMSTVIPSRRYNEEGMKGVITAASDDEIMIICFFFR